MSSRPATNYEYFGLRLQSSLPLRFLRAAPEDRTCPDIVLSEGKVPLVHENPIWKSPFVSVSADSSVLVSVGAIGRFFIESGSVITVQLSSEAGPIAFEAFLLSTVAGVILHQRGVLALHASCVEMGGRGIAIAGPAGSGKSTLAAALLGRGARWLSDGICPISFGSDCGGSDCGGSDCGGKDCGGKDCGGKDEAFVIPGPPVIRLWPDARQALADGDAWSRIREGVNVGFTRVDSSKLARSCRLGAVVRMESGNILEATVDYLSPPSALLPQREVVYRYGLGCTLGRTQELLSDLMRIASRVPVFSVNRPRRIDALNRTADALLAVLEGCL